MASFTDQITQFNPYIQQIPVDDYARVGMIKQSDYDQGVEKVQSYIDSVAGLEVVKPEQKDYLQQRIGQLQSEVSKVVQRDFSNQQLVNSVGNLTSKIASDPIIQTAVSSTQRYKAGMASMKAAREKGESGPSNEWYFNNQFQKWYSDKDVSSAFTGDFTKFTDVNKKVIAAIKEIDPNSQLEDIPYKRNGDGTYQKDAQGLPIIDYAMMEKSTKGVSAQRIQDTIMANLDQNDLRQLQIDGAYTYRGADKAGMKSITDSSYKNRLTQINDSIQGLLVDRQTNISDPKHIAQVDAQIQALQNRAQQYQNDYKRDIGALDVNPEGYKSSIYMQNYLSRFGDGYAYSQNSLTYKENPYFMAAERRRENDIKFQEFLVNKQFQQEDLKLKYAQLELNKEELKIKREAAAAKAKKEGGNANLNLVDEIPDAIDQELVKAINVDTYVAETEEKSSQIETEKMALLAQVRPDLVHVVRSADGIQKRYEYNVAGKDPNTVKSEAEATVLKLKDSYDKGETVDDGSKTYFDHLANTSQSIDNRKYALGKMYFDADTRYDVTQFTKKVAPLTVTLPDGKTSSISTEAMIRLNDKLSQAKNDAASNALFVTPEERYIWNAYKKSAFALPGITPTLNSGEQQALNKVREVSNLTSSSPVRAQTSAKNTFLNNSVRDIVGVSQPTSFTIEGFKAEDRNRVAAVARELVGSMDRRGTSSPALPGSEKFDLDNASKMLKDSNLPGTSFSLVSKGAGKYAIRVINNDIDKGGQEISITTQQANRLFGEDQFLDNFQRIRESLQLSKGTGKVTTDVQGTGAASAFSLKSANINNYGIKYHVEEPLKNGGLQLRLYIFDKATNEWSEKPVSFGTLLNESQITKALSGLTDASIDDILKKNK